MNQIQESLQNIQTEIFTIRTIIVTIATLYFGARIAYQVIAGDDLRGVQGHFVRWLVVVAAIYALPSLVNLIIETFDQR